MSRAFRFAYGSTICLLRGDPWQSQRGSSVLVQLDLMTLVMGFGRNTPTENINFMEFHVRETNDPAQVDRREVTQARDVV